MTRISQLILAVICFFSLGANALGQATQLSFVQGLPSNAGKNLPIYIDVCSTNGLGLVDQSYMPTITVSNNGGVAFTANPATTVAPTDGCVRFQIIPADTGNLNLSFTTSFFSPISTGNIRVDTFEIPSTDFVGEIFYPGNDPGNLALYQGLSDTLNDAWERRVSHTCNDSVPSSFSPVFGDIAFDGATYEGSITNLEILLADSFVSSTYTGTLNYRVVNMKSSEFASIKGEHHLSGSTFLSSAQVLQDSAPMPSSLISTGNNQRFTEVTGDFGSRNGLLFTFSQPVTQFGIFVGDVESNPNTTPAELVLFHGDVELRRDSLPTRSSAIEQSNSPADCGTYPGCGNRGTLWLEFFGAPVTDMLLIVGDDNSSGFFGFGGTEHLSFVGATMGGDCLLNPQSIVDLDLSIDNIADTRRLSWTSPHETEGLSFEVQRSSTAEHFEMLAKISANGNYSYQFVEKQADPRASFYRIKIYDKKGGIGYSRTVQSQPISLSGVQWSGLPTFEGQILQLPLHSDTDLPAKIRVSNMLGQLVSTAEHPLLFGKNQIKIPLGMNPGGFFLIEVSTKRGRLWKKIWL